MCAASPKGFKHKMKLWKMMALFRRLYSFRKCDCYGGKAWLKGRLILKGGGRFRIGRKFRTSGQVRLTADDGGSISIGNNVFFNANVGIACCSKIEIGDGVMIGNDTLLMDSDYHDVNDRSHPGKTGPIVIQDNVWIAMKVMILKNVTIGHGAVVAAGSVVTRNVPPYCLVAGNPARVVRQLRTGRNGLGDAGRNVSTCV